MRSRERKRYIHLKHHLFQYYWREITGADVSQIQNSQKKPHIEKPELRLSISG